MRRQNRGFCDFVVKYDEEKDTPLDLTKRILYSIIIKPIKAKKPRIIFLSGKSGEGKSYSSASLQELLCSIQDIDFIKHINDMNVFTPFEYPEKLKSILYDKELKKVNLFCIHEARDIIRATNWNDFLPQAIADVNAQARQIKRLVTIIISQFIRDITKEVRYTLNYYIKVSRPLNKRARLYIYVMWNDDRDLEKPKLRKRKLQGYIVDKKNRYQRYIPQYLELKKPSKEVCDMIDHLDKEAKIKITSKKIDTMIKKMRSEVGEENFKISKLLSFYSNNIENLRSLGKRRGKNWKLTPEAKDMLDLNSKESKEFEKGIIEILTNKKIINGD